MGLPVPAAFAVSTLLAVALVRTAAHAGLHVGCDHLPRWLLHSWSAGLVGLSAPFALFALPFLLAGEPAWALAGVLVALGVDATFGRAVVQRVVEDLRAHARDGRGLLHHDPACVLHDH